MLNDLQKTVILGFLKFTIVPIMTTNDPLHALRAIQAITNDERYKQYRHQFEEDDVLDSIDQIRAILRHPNPQNPSIGDPDLQYGLTPGGIVIGENGIGSDGQTYTLHIDESTQQHSYVGQPAGLLNLLRYQSLEETPVTTQEVTTFIRGRLQSWTKQLETKSTVRLKGMAESSSTASTSSSSRTKSKNRIKLTYDELDKERISILKNVQEWLQPFDSLCAVMNPIQLRAAIELLEAVLTAPYHMNPLEETEILLAACSAFDRFFSHQIAFQNSPLLQLFSDNCYEEPNTCFHSLKRLITQTLNLDRQLAYRRLIVTGEIQGCITRLIQQHHFLCEETGLDSAHADDDNDDIFDIITYSETVFLRCIKNICSANTCIYLPLQTTRSDYKITTDLVALFKPYLQRTSCRMVLPIRFPNHQFAAVIIHKNNATLTVTNVNLFDCNIPNEILTALSKLHVTNPTLIEPTPCYTALTNDFQYGMKCIEELYHQLGSRFSFIVANFDTGPAVIAAIQQVLSGQALTNNNAIVGPAFNFLNARNVNIPAADDNSDSDNDSSDDLNDCLTSDEEDDGHAASLGV